jgi:DnaJ-class molecular chaperone
MPDTVIGICGRCGGAGRILHPDFELRWTTCPLCNGRGSIRVLKEIFDRGEYPLRVIEK